MVAPPHKPDIPTFSADLTAVKEATIFEELCRKEAKFRATSTGFTVNPIMSARGYGFQSLALPTEKPLVTLPFTAREFTGKQSECYEMIQARKRLGRYLPVDLRDLPETQAQEIGWVQGVYMRLMEEQRKVKEASDRRPKSAPMTANVVEKTVPKISPLKTVAEGDRSEMGSQTARAPAVSNKQHYKAPQTARVASAGIELVPIAPRGSADSKRPSNLRRQKFVRPAVDRKRPKECGVEKAKEESQRPKSAHPDVAVDSWTHSRRISRTKRSQTVQQAAIRDALAKGVAKALMKSYAQSKWSYPKKTSDVVQYSTNFYLTKGHSPFVVR
ncbi:hypothetical protein FOL47_003050 [Perkinsus chesapeaki]|uniref:Uncharacterized protein n=1 Tax=Perkinsus chesapeaki TaxID=330153 RepID=A0A7J6MA17_PERCH|nr:hypothetical protein FOL47_003050 [Perkinsus chesapeaki]